MDFIFYIQLTVAKQTEFFENTFKRTIKVVGRFFILDNPNYEPVMDNDYEKNDHFFYAFGRIFSQKMSVFRSQSGTLIIIQTDPLFCVFKRVFEKFCLLG